MRSLMLYVFFILSLVAMIVSGLVHPVAAIASSTLSVRVHAGGGAYTDGAGNQWGADSGFSGAGTYATDAPIGGTADQALYQTERWGGGFSYASPLPSGNYAVTLKFAEIYWTQPGQRVFNVAINGQPVLTNFDIAAQVGRDVALDETFPVNVTGGNLTIAFTGLVDNAKVSAIQVVPASASGPATALPTATAAPTATAIASPMPATSRYLFGTLETDPSRANQEQNAGVRVADLELDWSLYEPQEGVYDANYAAKERQILQAYQAAGMKVVLSTGLQYPPAWIYNYSGTRYKNQYGNSPTGRYPNFAFSQTARAKAATYLQRIAQDFEFANFWAIRIGMSDAGEAVYPGETDDGVAGKGNEYWAFDDNAQGRTNDRPSSVSASPLPGWHPGQTTYNGQAVTASQVQQWYNWYLAALVDGVKWQIGRYQSFGFTGWNQVLTPGLGVAPRFAASNVAHYLDGTTEPSYSMGRGAVWSQFLPLLHGQPNVVVYDSNLGSAGGPQDTCQAADDSLPLNQAETQTWSEWRWLSYLADQSGFAKNGENPGRQDSGAAYGPALMGQAAAAMASCHWQGMMWAHDPDLYDSRSGVTLSGYASIISQLNH